MMIEQRADPGLNKTLIMERHVSYLRAIVISFNICAYFIIVWPDAPRAWLAYTIVGIATPYGAWSLLAKPYLRYPLLRFGAATLVSDALLITLWVLATGGTESEFWLLYFISVISVAMRYDLGQTVAAAIAEGLLYSVVMALDGGLGSYGAAVRPFYIVTAGLAAGFLARQERISNEERERFERLAAEHARMLERERKVVERLRELDEIKTQFVANAAHELRTPLTTLSGLALTLGARGDQLSPEQVAGALDSMRRQGERARQLIANLLDLSTLERERERLALAPVSLASVVRSALESAPVPEDKRVFLDVDDEVCALAEPGRLEQVIVNLLTNAYHYGGPGIVVRTGREGDDVVLSVEDDGGGVPAEVASHLFEPFTRGFNVGESIGSGLGLAISRRIMEAFGGALRYERGEGGGASFRLLLRTAA